MYISRIRMIKIHNGRRWGVIGKTSWHDVHIGSGDGGRIVIETNELGGMSPYEIGCAVLALAIEADIEQAREYAAIVTGKYPGLKHLIENAQLFAVIKSCLEANREKDASVAAAATLVTEFEERTKRRQEAALHKGERRKEVARRYSELFVELGRKHGYRCLACGAVEALQIDHVMPVSEGGSSDISNLQLLCGPCNFAKGSTVADYRTEAGE